MVMEEPATAPLANFGQGHVVPGLVHVDRPACRSTRQYPGSLATPSALLQRPTRRRSRHCITRPDCRAPDRSYAPSQHPRHRHATQRLLHRALGPSACRSVILPLLPRSTAQCRPTHRRRPIASITTLPHRRSTRPLFAPAGWCRPDCTACSRPAESIAMRWTPLSPGAVGSRAARPPRCSPGRFASTRRPVPAMAAWRTGSTPPAGYARRLQPWASCVSPSSRPAC
jgi:hypothetical protein